MSGPDPFVIAEEDLEEVLSKINAILAAEPKANIEWELEYYNEHGPIEKKERLKTPHEFITAKSEGLLVMVEGRESKVMQRRTLQPLNPEANGIVDNVLVIEYQDTHIFIYKNVVFVSDRDMEVGGLKRCITRSY